MGPGLILIAPFLVFDLWLIWTVTKEIFSNEIERKKMPRFIALLLIGIGLGVYLAFYFNFKPNRIFHLSGFPIPTRIGRLDKEQWTYSDLPVLVLILGQLTNFLSGITLGLLPLKISSTFKRLKTELSQAAEKRSDVKPLNR